jgi:hypothetical protein
MADSLEPYEKARDLYLDWCSDISGATPIEFGSVGSPGLSDLDLGIVFSKELDIQELSSVISNKMKNFPSLVKETMNGGTLMLFPEKSFFNILYSDDVTINSFDSKVDMALISESDEKLVSMAQIVEWLPERIAKIFLELNNEHKNIKRLIGFYFSLCYSLLKIIRFCGENEILNEFIINVYFLRNNWHHLDSHAREEKLKWMELNYVVVSNVAISMFSKTSNSYFNYSSIDFTNNYRYNLYSNIYLVSKASDEFPEIIRYKDGMININVPPIFLANYYIYSSCNSKLGKLIKNRSEIINDENSIFERCVSSEMLSILDIRIKMFSDFYSFVDKMNLGTGLYKFGWYLNDSLDSENENYFK